MVLKIINGGAILAGFVETDRGEWEGFADRRAMQSTRLDGDAPAKPGWGG